MGKTVGYVIHWEYQSCRGIRHVRSAAFSVCPANGGNPKPAEGQSSHPGWLQQSRARAPRKGILRNMNVRPSLKDAALGSWAAGQRGSEMVTYPI